MRTFALLISALLGAATTALLVTVGELALLLSGAIGLITAAASYIAIPSQKNDHSSPVQITAPRAELPPMGTAAKKEIAQLELTLSQIGHVPTKERLSSILRLAKQLEAAPAKDSRDESELRSFFNHYLPATVEIAVRYRELSQQPYQNDELRDALAKAETALAQIESAFHKQLSNLLKNDILDLNVEVSVLEHSLRLDKLLEEHSNSKETP